MEPQNYDIESVRQLIAKKDAIEQEIEDVTNKLKPFEQEGRRDLLHPLRFISRYSEAINNPIVPSTNRPDKLAL